MDVGIYQIQLSCPVAWLDGCREGSPCLDMKKETVEHTVERAQVDHQAELSVLLGTRRVLERNPKCSGQDTGSAACFCSRDCVPVIKAARVPGVVDS